MSNGYTKARVDLLDENTGQHIVDVEIISDSKEIFYNNDKPLPKAFGDLEKGTTFDHYPISSIVDNLLYDEVQPKITEYISSNTDDISGNENVVISKCVGSTVDRFYISIHGEFGSEDKITTTICIEALDGSHHKADTYIITRPDPKTDSFDYTFEVDDISKDTDIRIDVGKNKGKMISYRFVSPIYVGWVSPKGIFDWQGNLILKETEYRMQSIVDNPNKKTEIRYVQKSNQLAMIVPDINYDTREQLNPFIMIPQSWEKLRAIIDMNGNNITNSYARAIDININHNKMTLEKYIVYISRETFNDDEEFIKAVKYVTDTEAPTNVNMDKYDRFHTPLMVGYSVRHEVPLDERFYRKTYGELLRMKYPYPGLITYVEDINTSFRFENGHWAPFGNKVHIIEDWQNELTESFGGWDDLAIDATTGKIYKKRYNSVWERWGDLKVDINTQTVKINMANNGGDNNATD